MKIMIAHPAQQHSYRLAAALKRSGMLDRYLTTVYYRKPSLTWLVSKLLHGSFRTKAEGRTCPELSDLDVVQFCEGEGLLKLVALNTPFFKRHYSLIKYHTADRFAKKAARYAIRNGVDAVVTYDDSSPLLFEILQREAPQMIRIMDMSAANILYMREIYEKDFLLSPDFADQLKRERALCWDANNVERAEREIHAAQFFLSPSAFVTQSLIFSGVPEENIRFCPYGVDAEMFSQKDYPDYNKLDRPLRFIYVGGAKQLKGISYLLQAFASIPPEQAELIVVGAYEPDAPELQPYLDRVSFTGPVLHSEIPNLLQQADVFVFASLGDSFSLAVMEAAACGLPLILTSNTGAGDLITDGVEGFVIPAQSAEAIADRANYFVEHPQQITAMGKAAHAAAERNTWEQYSERITELLKELMCL